MRKAILFGLLAATMIPGLAKAQNRELRDDRRDIRQEQRDVYRAQRDGAPPHVIRDERRDVREARREYREDWRDHRRRNPAIYRGPRYVGPRGYAYRPIQPGYRFAPSYYGQRYRIDPYRYHLRPAGYRQRWIRYGNDAVLVDTRTGRTVQVFGGFFF